MHADARRRIDLEADIVGQPELEGRIWHQPAGADLMTSSGKIIVLLGMSLAVGSLSGEAFAVNNRTNAAARADVRQPLELMDKDKNGVVSRDEFLQFMGETFDRLDINRSGQLECSEVRQMTNSNWLHVGVNRPPKNK